ncbi:MAG: hypothetical protein LBJ11_02300 [Oscillospiraceae bacterium]|jgi:hypothetical protein|nr:hypothetical protein [Oscillospiraceae bacterium]
MKKIIRILFALLALAVLASCGILQAFAQEQEKIDPDLLNPDLFVGQGRAENISLEDQLVDLIEKYHLTGDQLQSNLAKAEVGGADLEAIAERVPSISKAQVRAAYQSASAFMVTRSAGSVSTRAAAAVPTPGTISPFTVYRQEQNTFCAAGTVQTALKCIPWIGSRFGASQTTIMNNVGTGPALQTVINYVNSLMTIFSASYTGQWDHYEIQSFAGGDHDLFDTCLNYSVYWKQPMIFTMSSPNKTNWPYTTTGHFVTVYGSSNRTNYSVGDPYYFTDYVAAATSNNGKLPTTWTKLLYVNRKLHGTGSEKFAY